MENPSRIWWEGILSVARRWSRESSSIVVNEQMRVIVEKIEELLDLLKE